MSEPHTSESPAATGLIAEQITDDTMIVDRVDAARKHFCNLRALLALRGGHLVHELAGGTYFVTWRGVSRHCADLDELEAHARRVGALA